MGELRKVSRKLELKLGAPKVYGTLKGGKASAPRKKELMRSRAALSTTTPTRREPRVHATARASFSVSGTALVLSSLLVGDVCYRAPSQQFPALIGDTDNRPNDGRSVLVPVLCVDPGLGHGGRVHLLRARGTQVWRLDLFQLCSGFRRRRCSTGEDVVQTCKTIFS